MEVKGKFEPPAMGQSHVPLPIAGAGSVSVTGSILRLVGYQGASDNSCLMAAVVVLSLLGLPIVLVQFGLELDGKVLGSVIFVPLLYYIMGKKKEKTTEPLELDIPIENIKSIKLNSQTQVVEILVVNQKPKGLVYFVPASDPGLVCSDLKTALKIQ